MKPRTLILNILSAIVILTALVLGNIYRSHKELEVSEQVKRNNAIEHYHSNHNEKIVEKNVRPSSNYVPRFDDNTSASRYLDKKIQSDVTCPNEIKETN